MKKKKRLIDTNIIIRFLTQDTPVQAKKIENLLKKAEKEELEIPDFILTEIVWVLISFYKLKKKEVIEKLEGILAFEKFKLERSVLKKAIEIYRDYNISFVDAYLSALAIKGNYQKLYSFDKRLKKVGSLNICNLRG